MMFTDIDREEEERLHKRGVVERKTAAELKYEQGLTAAELAREQVKEDRKFGKRPTRPRRSTTPGMVYDETWNPETGMWDRGEDYDPDIKTVAAQAQFMAGKQTPTMDMRNFEKSKTDPAFKAFLDEHNKIGGRPSAAIQNYEHLQTLLKITDPAKREIAVDNWWNTLRAAQYKDTGPAIKVFTPGDPGVPAATILKGLTPAQEPEHVKKIEEIKQTEALKAKRVEEAPKDRKIGEMKRSMQDSLTLISKWSTAYGSALKIVPFTDAQALRDSLKHLVANIGFQALQDMRQLSKTGGALGQVSTWELELLQATLGTLNQGGDPAILKRNLRRAMQSMDDTLSRMQGGFDETYKGFNVTYGEPGSYDGTAYNQHPSHPNKAKRNRRDGDKYKGWKVSP